MTMKSDPAIHQAVKNEITLDMVFTIQELKEWTKAHFPFLTHDQANDMAKAVTSDLMKSGELKRLNTRKNQKSMFQKILPQHIRMTPIP